MKGSSIEKTLAAQSDYLPSSYAKANKTFQKAIGLSYLEAHQVLMQIGAVAIDIVTTANVFPALYSTLIRTDLLSTKYAT